VQDRWEDVVPVLIVAVVVVVAEEIGVVVD